MAKPLAKVAAARRVACELLGSIRRREAHARDVLRVSPRMDSLVERDRSLVSRLVFGVVASSGMLDSVLNAHVSARAHLEPKVRDALRLATFELLFLSTPSAVAVSQGVELVRLQRPRAAGLANAVLHRIAQEDVIARQAALEAARVGQVTPTQLNLVCGYPTWLIEQVISDRGQTAATEYCLSALDPAPVYVATNHLLLTDGEAWDALTNSGLEPRACDLIGAFELGAPANLARTGLVEAAQVLPADLSAQRVVEISGPKPDMSVLEVGQGRGTKSLLMTSAAARAEGTMHIVGIDSESFKVRVAEKRMRIAGVTDQVACRCFDARSLDAEGLPPELVGPFDLVLVDAPCSGTGTLRRHPEIVWNCTPSKVWELSRLQLSILEAAASRVRMDGVLCYATCSVLKAENERAIKAFLASDAGSGFAVEGSAFQSMPISGGPDGHFCQCLRRIG